MAAPDGSSRRPAPRPTTDDGTLTRERHRLACGSPSRAPGRRPGGVTLRFSDRCPVHDGDGDLRFRAAPWWSTRFPAWRRPTGRADRPGPRSTADDGTLTRERHRLACGSPSRAPGRRPGGVTLGFSDRCPVPDGDGDIWFRTARGGRRDLQRGARRRGLGALPAHCHAAAPRLSGLPRGGSLRPGRWPAREACAWRRPTGRADRPGPRSTADDGTLTRERHRLACGSPSRAPGRRPGGVTLGFSDRCPVSGARRRRRHPVPYRPWWSTRPPAWRAPAWTGQLTRWWADTFPPMLSRHRARAGRVTRNWPVPGWKRSTIFLRTVGNIPK